MAIRFDHYHRLETRSNDRDLQRGFSAPIHDPVWFLARQWQMGEHQGENASSPVVVTFALETTPVESPEGATHLNPRSVPAEMIVESEIDDWWTMGRRIRLGHSAADGMGWLTGTPPATLPPEARFHNPSPPYERFHNAFDGKMLWRLRNTLGIADALFGPAADRPPPETPFTWNSEQFHYQQTFPTAERPLIVDRHRGGAIDWYSADGDQTVALQPRSTVTDSREVIPTPLEYPGAPHSRWWEIEDAAVDIGGYPPDMAHFATMVLVDLIFSHGDDWFLFPVTAPVGHIVTIADLVVRDAFGREYDSADPQWTGLRPPDDWSIFATEGLRAASLVLWSVAELPLEGALLERVQFGIDEQSNLVWAVERTVDGREVDARRSLVQEDGAAPVFPEPVPETDLDATKQYQYAPGRGITLHWHPYLLQGDNGRRVYRQGGLADFSRQIPMPLPPPEAEVLKGGTPDNRALHQVVPAALPSQGVELERRWMMARDASGNPILWIQRQRKPLRTPPGRTLRFDLLEETRREQP